MRAPGRGDRVQCGAALVHTHPCRHKLSSRRVRQAICWRILVMMASISIHSIAAAGSSGKTTLTTKKCFWRSSGVTAVHFVSKSFFGCRSVIFYVNQKDGSCESRFCALAARDATVTLADTCGVNRAIVAAHPLILRLWTMRDRPLLRFAPGRFRIIWARTARREINLRLCEWRHAH